MLKAVEELNTPKDGNPLLASIQEINVPADISWWPQTLGWQLLLLSFFCYLLYRLALVIRRYISNIYRRTALLELQEVIDIAELQKIPLILRKTALYAYPREQVAPLIGVQWEQWLDKQCQGSQFFSHFSGQLATLAYCDQSKLSSEQLVAIKSQVATWIKHHRGTYD